MCCESRPLGVPPCRRLETPPYAGGLSVSSPSRVGDPFLRDLHIENRHPRSFDRMSTFGASFEEFQREAEARTLGAELYREASDLSSEAVEAVAAVLLAVVRKSSGQLPAKVASEFAWQMMADRALGYYESELPF